MTNEHSVTYLVAITITPDESSYIDSIDDSNGEVTRIPDVEGMEQRLRAAINLSQAATALENRIAAATTGDAVMEVIGVVKGEGDNLHVGEDGKLCLI